VKILPLILVLPVLILAGCGPEKSALPTGQAGEEGEISTDLVSNPISASADGGSSQEVIMTFEDNTYDFGEIIQGEKVAHSFNFTNEGNAPLIISSVRASCGCTVPTWSKEPIEPGDSDEIKVVFDSDGKSGAQAKDITIVSNAVPNTSVLRITGEVIVP